MSDRKLTRNDEMVLKMLGNQPNYTVYDCPEHGLYAIHVDFATKTCPHCNKECDKYEQE